MIETPMMAVSDTVWTSIIGGIVTVVLGWMTYKLNVMAKTGEKIHILVNSAMGNQLKINAIMARRLAVFTKNKPGNRADVESANLAERLLKEHEEKQQVIDMESTT